MSKKIYGWLLYLVCCAAPAVLAQAQDQPNILWIITDDERADALSCFNQATIGQHNSNLGYVESPNIDQIASEGVLFIRAYCNSPACAPSRGSMHSGQYPHHSGRYGFEQTHTLPDVNKPLVPQVLRARGYRTAHFGKSGYYIFGWGPGQSYIRMPFYNLFIDHQAELARKGFGDWSRMPDEETFWFPNGSHISLPRGPYADLTEAGRARRDAFDLKYDILRAYTRSNTGLILGGVATRPASQCTDAFVLKEFQHYLGNPNTSYQTLANVTEQGADTTKPLMIHLGFHFPHSPVLPPQLFRDRFKDKTYNIPEFDKREVDRLPAQLVKLYQQMKIDEMTYEQKQQVMRDYYAFCAYGDSLIGEAVRAFKEYSEANGQDYLIMLASGDHGWHLGEQGISAKFGPYDMSNHTAVVVVSSDKTAFPAGIIDSTFIEYVDFAPTIYAAAGIDVESPDYEYLDGYDLAKVVNKSLPERDYVFGEMNSVYGPRAYLRSEEFAFSMRVREKNNQPSATYPPNNHIMWALSTSRQNAEMALYDMRVDPKERTNVAYESEYASLADWFRIKLGNIACGDGRVEVVWSEENTYNISNFAPGADDKLLDIPPGIIPDVASFTEINFQVYKKKNNAIDPLQSAEVKIDSLTIFTDSTGRASGFLKNGTYEYSIESDGLTPAVGIIGIDSSTEILFDTLDVIYYQVEFKLAHETTQVPVANASIFIGESEYVADASGVLIIDTIVYGDYLISAAADLFDPIENLKISIRSDTVISLRMSPRSYPQTLSILNAWNRSPVNGATILIDSVALTSNTQGVSTINLATGSYQISVEKPRFQTYYSVLQIEGKSVHEIPLEQLLADVIFRMKYRGSSMSNVEIIFGNDTLISSSAGLAYARNIPTDSTYAYSFRHANYSGLGGQLTLHTDTILTSEMWTVQVEPSPSAAIINLFPNPANSTLTIRGFGKDDQLIISDLLGITMLNVRIKGPEASVDISDIPSGIYILQLTGKGIARKIIKK